MDEQLTVEFSPLQLEGYFVREFSFAVRPGLEDAMVGAMQQGLHIQSEGFFNPDEITFNIQAGGGAHIETPSRWMTVVEIETANPPERKVPYDFRIVLVGYFKLHESITTSESIDRSVRINATSILYSAAREYIAGATGRGPFPAIILPSVVIGLQLIAEQKGLPASKKEGRKRTTKRTSKKGTSKKKSG